MHSTAFDNIFWLFCVTSTYFRLYSLVMAVSSRLKLPVLLLRYRVTTCFLINPRFDRKKYNFVFFLDANSYLFIFPNGFQIFFNSSHTFACFKKTCVFRRGVSDENTTGNHYPYLHRTRRHGFGFLLIFFSLFSISFLWPSYISYFSVIIIFFYTVIWPFSEISVLYLPYRHTGMFPL